MTYLDSKSYKNEYIYLTILHRWLRVNYGKANKCENKENKILNFECKSNPKRFEYALIKGKKYEQKRENFIMLCPSCHRKYDYTNELKQKFIKRIKGQKWNNEKIIAYNKNGDILKTFDSLKSASKELNILRTSISNCLTGRSKSAGKYIWKYV